MIYIIFMLLQTFVLLMSLINERGNIGYVNLEQKVNKKNNIALCAIAGLFLFIIAGFRSVSVGADTGQYIRRFLRISVSKGNYAFAEYSDEPGFYVLCKVVLLFSKEPQALLIVTGLIYAASFSYYIYKNSVNPAISYLMLFPMQFYSFILTGMRQALAFSIVVFFYTYSKEKKHSKIIFLLGVIIAFLFHKSAIVSIGYLFINDNKISDGKRYFFVVLLPLVYVFGRPILNFFQSFLYSDYELYESPVNKFATLLVYFGIWLLYVIFIQKDRKYFKGANSLEKYIMIGCLLQMLVPYNPNFFRVAMYYQLTSIIVVPEIIERQHVSLKSVLSIGFMLIMFLMFSVFTYYSAGINPYSFFGG